MEFIRNNINAIEAQHKVQEQIKTDKVHSAEEVNVKNDLKDKEKEKDKDEYRESQKNNSKKSGIITVDGVKNCEDELLVEAEKVENISTYNSKGRFLDAKK